MLQEDKEGPLQAPRQRKHQVDLVRREEQHGDGDRVVRRRGGLRQALLRRWQGDHRHTSRPREPDHEARRGQGGAQAAREREGEPRRPQPRVTRARQQPRRRWQAGQNQARQVRHGRRRQGSQQACPPRPRPRTRTRPRPRTSQQAEGGDHHRHVTDGGSARAAAGVDDGDGADADAHASADAGHDNDAAGDGRTVHLAAAGRSRPGVGVQRPAVWGPAWRRVLRRARVLPRRIRAVRRARQVPGVPAAVLRGAQRRVQRHVITRRPRRVIRQSCRPCFDEHSTHEWIR